MDTGKPEARYHIKYAESPDGITWKRKGIVAIDYKSLEEAGIVRSSVLATKGGYLMWYSYRGGVDYRTSRATSYRIGYAESKDAVTWERMDEQVGIGVSREGWDSMMVEYPHVVESNGARYMFYNGNGFGQSGFGYAVMSKA